MKRDRYEARPRRLGDKWREPGPLDAVAEFLDGRKYKLDGILGIFRVSVIHGRYPIPEDELRIYHEATPAGRKTEAYLKVRRELHDDWSSDLTHSERLWGIAEKLGFKWR